LIERELEGWVAGGVDDVCVGMDEWAVTGKFGLVDISCELEMKEV